MIELLLLYALIKYWWIWLPLITIYATLTAKR